MYKLCVLFNRAIIIASLTTLETFTRGAIECFMTKTVLNIVDKVGDSSSPLHELMGVFGIWRPLSDIWKCMVVWIDAFLSIQIIMHFQVCLLWLRKFEDVI